MRGGEGGACDAPRGERAKSGQRTAAVVRRRPFLPRQGKTDVPVPEVEDYGVQAKLAAVEYLRRETVAKERGVGSPSRRGPGKPSLVPGGVRAVASEYGLSSISCVQRWIGKLREMGVEVPAAPLPTTEACSDTPGFRV